MNTITNTSTYTVVDIRKTFEGFSADFRMIASRTGKMNTTKVENCLHDIMAWAENKYIDYIDITLIDTNNTPIKASRYSVDESGKAIKSDRAGNNDWKDIPNTQLTLIISQTTTWYNLSPELKEKFKESNNFKINWGPSNIDNSYSHLSKENAQVYASKGYELKKENFK
jgi:hypothetical protein